MRCCHKYISFLNGFAALLIFFNVMTGICGDKNTEPLSSKSKRIFIRMPIMLIIVTAMGYLLSLVLSDVTFSAHSNNSESQTGRIAQMLWDLVPEDVITPFQDKNYIHILMIALILGTAISVIRDSYPELIASLNGISQAFMSVTAKICSFVPVYVFCFLLSFNTFLQGTTSLIPQRQSVSLKRVKVHQCSNTPPKNE